MTEYVNILKVCTRKDVLICCHLNYNIINNRAIRTVLHVAIKNTIYVCMFTNYVFI